MRALFLILVAGATVTACAKRDPVADNANGAALPAPTTDMSPNPAGAPPDDRAPSSAASATPSALTIPAALQGRWGLTPGDCTSTRGDAKGLLTVSPNRLTFYESRAVPGTDLEVDPGSVAGTFSFTGEGQSWTKFEALKVAGDKLVRTETDPQASFTYAKC